jgi:hypothetical protein
VTEHSDLYWLVIERSDQDRPINERCTKAQLSTVVNYHLVQPEVKRVTVERAS